MRVSKRPSADAVRGMELSVGSHARRQAAFDFGGPVGDDGTVSYRLVGLARAADQQIDFMRDDRVYLAPSPELRKRSADEGAAQRAACGATHRKPGNNKTHVIPDRSKAANQDR